MEHRLRQLLAINRAIAETLDFEEVLELVVEKASELEQAAACALLLSDDRGVAHVVAWRGIPNERAEAFAAPLDERINVALRGLLDYRDEDVFLGVPVIHAGEVRGILVVHREGSDARVEDEEMILSALADQAAIALDHASRYRQLWLESQAAQRELEAAARRKDEFLAMLSHELRNPLAAIVNAHSALRLIAPGDAKTERVHDIAARQTAHMKRLLDDLLDVSRVTQDKIDLERSTVSLQAIVQQAVLATQTLVAERHLQLDVALPPDPVLVEGDADRLVQVISNLLSNAAKFSDPEGRIHLLLTREEGEAVLRVRDEGIGIDAELLPSVFDLFVQAERPAGRGQGGLGVGLALVRRLVEMHGGHVAARSAGSGQGSEFEVRLPLAPPEARLAGAAASTAAAPESRHVLLVEDNADVAEMLAEALTHLGHHVQTAADGETALAEANQERWDLVLVDIGLPGMDGYELARRLRALDVEPQPLLVALTGYGSAQDRERARDAGFDLHLVKPVRLDQLTRLLASHGG